VSPDQGQYKKVRIMVETAERTFRGFLFRPADEETMRLSDYLNEYDRPFLCLADVAVTDRGQIHRPGDKRDFVAISVSEIHYITPMRDGEV
jgi:hypothetical protein